MSWSAGADLFDEAIDIFSAYFSSEQERIIYLSNFLNTLMDRDMDYDRLLRHDREKDATLLRIEKRWDIYNKYLKQLESRLKDTCNYDVLNHHISKFRRAVEESELKAVTQSSSSNVDAFIGIYGLSEKYEVDDEYYVADLIYGLHLKEKEIKSLESNQTKIYSDYQLVVKEEHQRVQQISKKQAKVKNWPEIESTLKKTETALKRALTRQRKMLIL